MPPRDRRSSALFLADIVIGEVASCLTDDVREKLPELPWRQIRGFRNHAVHAYFSLDWEIVREVAEVDLPRVEPAVSRLIAAEYPEVTALL